MISVFDTLHSSIQQFLSKQKITTATEPQTKAIPPILRQENTLLIAPTGLGKTEAAILPIFHNFLQKKNINNKSTEKGISILYITPLRALNRDMLQRTIKWGNELNIKVAVRHGDTTSADRAKQSRSPPNMLITTPETLQILFTGKRLRQHLKTVQWVVIDEIHELASDERGAQLAVALERLYELTKTHNHSFQRIGLSATIGDPQEVATYLGGTENKSPRKVTIVEVDVTKHINLTVELPTIQKSDETIATQLRIEPISFALLRKSKKHLDDHISTLLFINTRDGAEILTSRFHQWQKDYPIEVHHGSLSKQARIDAENNFKKGALKALICTSSLELGIDVGNTDFVLQYNSPRQITRLIQRVGRSGHRIGKTSEGLILTSNTEDFIESAVIARRALQGKVEIINIRKNPLTVLSNQIINIVLEYGSISSEKIYDIITRSYPFITLTKQKYSKILNQIHNQRSIWFQEEDKTLYLQKRRFTRTYFLDNISMIPDENTYSVVDISTRRIIGTLDESFVLNAGFEGEKFILKGRPWMILKREEDSILVSSIEDQGEAPSWIGEDIPVPYEVALEVGKIRRKTTDTNLLTQYPTSKKSMKQFIDLIQNQQSQNLHIPSDKLITIELDEKTVIINACFGTKVNETLGRIIAALLAQNIGESIGITIDPYRIILELPGKLPPESIKKLIESTTPNNLDYLLETILKNSTYIRWQLVHVARKFGALRKDFDYKNIGMKKLLGIFEQTQVMDEALDKLIWERMDIEHTRDILTKIQNGTITLHIQGISPIGTQGFETTRGLMVPQRADRTILMALKNRLEDTAITLVCTNCHHTWDTHVRRTAKKPHCPKCKAIRIAVLRRHLRDDATLLSKPHPTKEERKTIQRLNKNASLILSYGYPAILTQISRGIGPDTTARLLSKFDRSTLEKNEEEFLCLLREILRAEILYARTRGFWDK
jgi:ATP-dependent Lhr-like helicase